MADNTVPPPASAASDFEVAKQRAQEVVARLLGSTPAVDLKHPKQDNDSSFDSVDVNEPYSVSSTSPSAVLYSHQGGGASKKIDIPNAMVGVIIGKGGETIKYLQLQSGTKIQVTRDMDADPNSSTRMVELLGTPDAIASAEKLINEVLAEAKAGVSGTIGRRLTRQAGFEENVMMIPNNKVGLIIGKGGETIRSIQASTGTRIQVIPLHLPPGDTSTERTLKIEGTPTQIESAKQLVDHVISGETRYGNLAMSGGYFQQGYQARPPTSWGGFPAVPMQQPGYGYVQPGAYSGPPPQYNMLQQPYAGYPPQGYSTNWDQSTVPPQQPTHVGYDYYNQQNPVGLVPPADGSAYGYNQPPSSGYSQPGECYPQQDYDGYHVPPQPGYDQQQGYGSAPSYGMESYPGQKGYIPNYGNSGYGTGYPQPQAYSSDAAAGGATHGTYEGAPAQADGDGVAKTSP